MNSSKAPPSVCREPRGVGHKPWVTKKYLPLGSHSSTLISAPQEQLPLVPFSSQPWHVPGKGHTPGNTCVVPACRLCAEGGSCPYSPLAVYLPGIAPSPQSALVSPPAGGRSGKAEQGCAALPGKKAQLWAGQAVDGRRNSSWFPFAKLSLTLLMLAESSLLLTSPMSKPPPHPGQLYALC